MIRVVVPPEPFVTPADIAGATAGDAAVEELIAAATAEIDGPTGSIGRAIGPQTLEIELDCWSSRPIKLPCPPIIGIVSIKYIDQAGVEQVVDDTDYGLSGELLWLRQSWQRPVLGCVPGGIKIQYRAGYEEAKTGKIPVNAKRAVILKTQYLRSIASPNLFLKTSEVEGVGRIDYIVSDQAGNVIDKAVKNLLRGLEIPRL